MINSVALMFCPQCKAEYRPGFTRCADCDVDLVDHLPAGPPPEPYESVWSGENREGCVFACRSLKSLGIPYTVDQKRNQLWGRQVEEHYEIAVPAEFSSQAKAELGKGAFDLQDLSDSDDESKFQNNDELQSLVEFPEDDGSPVVEGPRDFKPWFPEDATVEIYSEMTKENEDPKAWMVEAALRENMILSRTESTGDDLRKVFVMPNDETQAREIVREIIEATPSA